MLAIGMMAVAGGALAQQSAGDSTKTLTGCLEKNRTAKVYLLTDGDGKMWELRSASVPLDPHVGQTITVTGTIPDAKDSKDSENSDETAGQNYLNVTKVEMVRDNCKPQ
jgi:hypothetical protein